MRDTIIKDVSKKYNQLYKDIGYIREQYGHVEDYCGAWCQGDLFEELLKCPNKKVAFKILISKLERYFEKGTDEGKLHLDKDKKLQDIKKRWLENIWEFK